MFDVFVANSYIEVYGLRYYLEESYSTLENKMNDDSSTISVHVVDFTGFLRDFKTFDKSEIESYGSN